jgi:hypothetical protein
LHEIHLLSERGNERQCHLAMTALENMLRWRIMPFNLNAVGHGLTARFAEMLIAKNLLPESECNDGMILGEAALLEFPVLITSDNHLLQIDDTSLKIAFDDCGLAHVAPVHPFRLLRALR